MRVKIGKRYWDLRLIKQPRIEDERGKLRKCDGTCTDPSDARKRIRIKSGLVRKRMIETICHEITHARVWDIDEVAVGDIGEACGEIIDRLIADGVSS